MSNYRVISSDNHVFEPVDLWATRGEAKFRDRAPRIVHLEGVEGSLMATGGSVTTGRWSAHSREPRLGSGLKSRKS